jgi:ABC-2 type transport system permease protein
MLADAVASEAYRLRRNGSARFWGFVFVPAMLLLFNLALDTYLRVRLGTGVGIDLGLQILRALGAAGSPYLQIFYALGAATIFAGDYRWETWRLIAMRNSRSNLLFGKFIVYGAACGLSLLGLVLMGVVHTFYGGLLASSFPALPQSSFVVTGLAMFAASWIELMLVGAIVAVVAVATRAMMGAALVAVMFGLMQSAALTQMSLAPSLPKLAFVPRFAAETLGAFVSGRQVGPDFYIGAADGLVAALCLVCWIVILGAAALVIFRRQDLSRE